MTDRPRVSIITPSYNQAAYLEHTILSVLRQDYPDLEYFVVDGASDDGSVEIIRKYADRIAWWVSEPDRGQGEAINKGFSRATGEIVAWLNSDDVYLPGAVASAVDQLMANPSCGLVYGDVLSLGAGNEPIHVQRFPQYHLTDLMRFRIISQPAVFMRRSALEECGFLDNRFQLLLDHHLWLRIARQFPILHHEELWAAARYHGAAKNLARAGQFGEEAFRLVAWMREMPDFAGLYQEHEKQIIGGAAWLDAYYLSLSGAPRQALAAYWKSLRNDPKRALKDWKRVLFTAGSLIGLEGLGKMLQARKQGEVARVYRHYLEFIEPHSGVI